MWLRVLPALLLISSAPVATPSVTAARTGCGAAMAAYEGFYKGPTTVGGKKENHSKGEPVLDLAVEVADDDGDPLQSGPIIQIDAQQIDGKLFKLWGSRNARVVLTNGKLSWKARGTYVGGGYFGPAPWHQDFTAEPVECDADGAVTKLRGSAKRAAGSEAPFHVVDFEVIRTNPPENDDH